MRRIIYKNRIVGVIWVHFTTSYAARRILLGAIGAEMSSAFTWASTCIYWLATKPPPPFGYFFTAFSGKYAYYVISFYLLTGLVHLVTLGLAPSRWRSRLRKLAIVPQVGMWAGVTFDVWQIGAVTSVISFMPMLLGLFIAILRTPVIIDNALPTEAN